MSRGRHRQPRRSRTGRAAAVVALAAGGAILSSAWSGAAADAPVKYGWWSAANNGAPVTPPPPPDVPPKGLYVANGFAGPTAVSALSFAVPTGATVTGLTLKVTGNPIMTAPPMACPIAPAASNYTPAEGGAWAAKPAYDCSKGAAKGAASTDGKSVTFPVAALVRSGALDVAIVASGQADRIPFEQPDASALTVTAPVAATGSGTTPTSGGGGGAYGGQSATSTTPAKSAPNASVAAPAPPSTAGMSATGSAVGAGVPPAVAPPQQANQGAGNGTSLAGASPMAARSTSGTRHDLATALGLAAVVGALLFWTEGFGLLGGRVASLAGRRRPPAYPDEPGVIALPSTAANS